MENDIKMYKPSLDKKIYDMLQSHSEMITLIQERNEIGTENGIKKEIEKLKSKRRLFQRKFQYPKKNLKSLIRQLRKFQF